MNAANPSGTDLHRATLLKVVAAIERRIADLDRLGPPNARGYACTSCRDAELHRLLGVLREVAARGPGDEAQRLQRPASTKEK
jgi:hypothetical protein